MTQRQGLHHVLAMSRPRALRVGAAMLTRLCAQINTTIIPDAFFAHRIRAVEDVSREILIDDIKRCTYVIDCMHQAPACMAGCTVDNTIVTQWPQENRLFLSLE
eukprot:m.975498 g.975498  ORF g.975498 m.975498 type:complete len:104 (+) comp23941_c0_seq2:3530-3841(+)